MKTVCLSLPYPISANAYWGTRVITPKGGRPMSITYVTHEAREYKKTVEQLARAAGIREPITGRVMLEIWLYPGRPLDWQTRQRKLGAHWDTDVRCIDLDNANKVLLDALKDIVMADDKFVFKIASQRMEPDAVGARTVVRITKIEVPVLQGELAELAGFA